MSSRNSKGTGTDVFAGLVQHIMYWVVFVVVVALANGQSNLITAALVLGGILYVLSWQYSYRK